MAVSEGVKKKFGISPDNWCIVPISIQADIPEKDIRPGCDFGLEAAHKGGEGLFFFFVEFEFGDDIEEFDRVFKGEEPAVVHIRR